MKRSKKQIEPRELLSMLPKELFTFLSKKYEVDYRVRKLSGEVVFLTMIETLFSSKSFSLRSAASEYENEKFQKYILKNKDFLTIDHTAFHYRLSKIDSNYFKEIFEAAKKIFTPYLIGLSPKHKTLIFDSTIVTHSAKLLKSCGYQTTGKKTKKHIKYTIAYGRGIPQIAKSHTRKKYNSENIALSEAILSHNIPKNQIILFDRGLQHRETYDKITEKGNLFVSRLNQNYLVDALEEKKNPSKNPEINITKEVKGYLYSTGKAKKTKYTYRIIHLEPNDEKTAQHKEDRIKKGQAFQQSRRKKHANKTKEELYEAIQKQEIIFITNIPEKDVSAEEITEIYRERWQIEVFFRFLKQELHFSHLINRTEKGIESIMYITMTYAIIFLAFKMINNLEGYKHVKRRFMMDAEYQRFLFVRKIMRSRPDVGEVFNPQFW